MKKYKVQLSNMAKNDYKNIVRYIKYELLEPNIAQRYSILIKDKIKTLEFQPDRFAVLEHENLKKYEFRKIAIKNYIAFYRINEDKAIVNIERILHSGTDWVNKI